MITILEELHTEISFDLKRFGDPESLLFFDIETTGLNPAYSAVYLISCLSVEKNVPVFRQWLAESKSEEFLLLKTFADFSENFDTLIHYNGDHFDIPFLASSMKAYPMIRDTLSGKKSVDLYKMIRKWKRFFSLENCKLKSIEIFLNNRREDLYNGGELIPVYEEYTKTKRKDLERLLLLHNREDVISLLEILPIFHYTDCVSDLPDLPVKDRGFSESGTAFFCSFSFPYVFPKSFSREFQNGIFLRFENSELSLRIPAYTGELKCFYKNVSDYFYLYKEDQAIHKKLARFVDPENVVPATKETCYTKASGRFLLAPQRNPILSLRTDFSSEITYLPYKDEDLFLQNYLRDLRPLLLK